GPIPNWPMAHPKGHGEERSEEAISTRQRMSARDCVAALAMTRQAGNMERIEIAGISVETEIVGTGPPLLFLHGGDYVAQNRPFLDRLAARFRVVMPRHPGFGD